MGELQEAGRVQALCYSIIGYLGCSLGTYLPTYLLICSGVQRYDPLIFKIYLLIYFWSVCLIHCVYQKLIDFVFHSHSLCLVFFLGPEVLHPVTIEKVKV